MVVHMDYNVVVIYFQVMPACKAEPCVNQAVDSSSLQIIEHPF